MGITYIEGTVRNDGTEEQVEFLVDSGAGYTLLPERVWKSLGLKPKREMDFILADGTRVSRNISECWIELPQGDGHTPVILGESRDEALLGVVTGVAALKNTDGVPNLCDSWSLAQSCYVSSARQLLCQGLGVVDG